MKKLNKIIDNQILVSSCPACKCFDQCSSCYVLGYDMYSTSVKYVKGGNNSATVTAFNERTGTGTEPF